MATKAKQGSKDGIEWRTDSKGRKRYRGMAYSKATGKQYGPWGSHAEAKAWRSKALGEIEAGVAVKSQPVTLREAWAAFFAGAQNGTIPSARNEPFKPATLRGYQRGWKRIDPELGAHRLTDIQYDDVQAMVDRWAATGEVDGGTIDNWLDPLRALYRRAIRRKQVRPDHNPTVGLEIPKSVNGDPMRFASREEASALVAAVPEEDRALWASAMYGGLRRSELRALRWSDVKLGENLIDIARAWDDNEGEQTPKTKGSARKVPIIPALRALLEQHAQTTGRSGHDLVFGRTEADPFVPSTIRARALKGWAVPDPPLDPITLHQCRHSFASLMIAAGCNAKALSVVMGHASITITFDRYGHLMPGGEAEVGRLLAQYVNGAS